MTHTLTVAIIGLGEVGSLLGAHLRAEGAVVVGFDSKPSASPVVDLADTIEAAVKDADLVLSTNTATAALRVAQQVAPHLKPGAIVADLNSGNPALKERIAGELPRDALVDVAIMTPVSETGVNTPLIAAGPSAEKLVALLEPFGLNIQTVSTKVGDASARALTRTLVSKFIAGALIDSLWAAQALGLDDMVYEDMLAEFDAMNADTAKRLIHEVVSNPKRREIEMLDIVEMLDGVDHKSLFVPATQLVYNKVYHSIKVPHVEK